MNPTHPTGLGNPEPQGKKALFQPPKKEQKSPRRKVKSLPGTPPPLEQKSPKTLPRIRTTIKITSDALKIIQGIQQRHRLETGKVLPLWKAISQAIEFYGKHNRVGDK